MRAGDQCEVAAVRYETNILGTKGPRRMMAVIPEVVSENGRPSLSNQAFKTAPADSTSLLDRCSQNRMCMLLLVLLGFSFRMYWSNHACAACNTCMLTGLLQK